MGDKCTRCGAALAGETKFCPNCGAAANKENTGGLYYVNGTPERWGAGDWKKLMRVIAWAAAVALTVGCAMIFMVMGSAYGGEGAFVFIGTFIGIVLALFTVAGVNIALDAADDLKALREQGEKKTTKK